MTKKEQLLIYYANARIRWMMALVQNTWLFTLGIAGFSFLAGFHLSRQEVLVFSVQGMAVLVSVHSVFRMIRFYRKDDSTGDKALFAAIAELEARRMRDDE